MNSRDMGRAIAVAAAGAAAASTSIRRAVIREVLDDGRYLVELANGGRIKVATAAGLGEGVEGTSVSLVRLGAGYEILDVSAWQGGAGASP